MMKKRVLSMLMALLMVLSLVPTMVFADVVASGTCGAEGDGSNLTWTLDSDGVLTISGTGEMANYTWITCGPWSSYSGQITSVVIDSNVTTIGGYAFSGCSSLTDVTIGNSVTIIGGYAFNYCSSLESIIIPEGVTSIDSGAFDYCSSLGNITIPNSMTMIDRYAFSNCNSLTDVYYGKDRSEWLQIAYWTVLPSNTKIHVNCGTEDEYTFSVVAVGTCGTNLSWILDGDGMLTISGEGAMYSYSSQMSGNTSITTAPWERYIYRLKSVVIDEGVTSIGDYAFYTCRYLTSIDVPDSVTSIGDRAFFGCSSLTSVTIPDSVTSMGDWAFCDCGGLTSVTIPDSVTSIGDGAFSNCRSLQVITVSEDNNNYCSIDGVLYNKEQTELICCPGGKTGSVTIPDSVTSIGGDAFYGCSSLTGVTIPDSVTSIGDAAFANCSSLTSVTIPDSVTSIGFQAFRNCRSLTNVMIPSGVTSIKQLTFANCGSLTSVTIPESVTSIGEWVFSDCNRLQTVYYGGTETQWNAISIGDYNLPLQNATKHYSHVHQFIQNTVVDPSCTEQGYAEHLCIYGETVRDSYVPALGHSYDNDAGVVTAPTCTEQGCTTYTCTRCGESYQTNFVDALPHDYEVVAVTSPSCTEPGYTTYTCSRCGESSTDDYTDALGHHPVADEAVEATCGEDGHTIGSHCDRCGEVFIQPKVIPATGEHVSTGAHCATTSHRAICDVCGQEYGELLAVSCDLNGDGDTDTDDLTMLLRHVAKIAPIEDTELLAKADLDGSDTVDAVDVTILAQALAK